VALVVTIVVLLILAGITITYVMGDNSIFNKASNAKLNTELAKIEEQASLIYADKLLQKVQTNLNNKPTMQEIVGELRNEGYTIEQIAVNENEVTGILLDKEIMSLSKEKSNTIQVTLEGNSEPYNYYVKVENKYYQMHFNGGVVTIDRTESDISNIGGTETTQSLSVSSSDDTIATATIDSNTNIITVTAKNTTGTVEITVSHRNYTKVCKVRVCEIATGISLNETSYVVTGGESWINNLQLKATVTPENADQTVTWKSSDTSIATVDSNGLVKAKAGGKGGDIKIIATTADGTNLSAECEITVEIFSKIKTSKTEYIDAEGNKAIIPQGFAVGTSDNVNKVTGGLVIQDDEGNQFVWIPVGEIKKADGTTTDITLGRYIFDKTNGTPTLVQNADDYTQIVDLGTPGLSSESYQELNNNLINTSAKNLGGFVTKTKLAGGYYFGRYEASKSSNGKAKIQYDKTVWGEITQPNAAIAAREMYSSSYIESDLINSYSWDTAIVFIQRCSENSNYANKKTVNTERLRAGRSKDKICNIYDIASNCREWTTEHFTRNEEEGTLRGGNYARDTGYAAARLVNATTFTSTTISFRTNFYVN